MKLSVRHRRIQCRLTVLCSETRPNAKPENVKDIRQTIDFYKQLGFELVMTNPEQGEFIWVMMACGNVVFMFQTFDSLTADLPDISRQDGGSLLFYIKVKNIRALFGKIKDNVNVLKEPEKTFYGATEFTIRDNNNYVLTFAEDE